MAGRYRVLVGGTELPGWESVSLDNSLDLTLNKATIVWPDLSTMNFALKQVGEPVLADVLITRDGANLWRGLGWHRSRYLGPYSGGTHRRYQLQCMGNKKYLEREAFRYTNNGSEGGAGTYFDVIYGGAQQSTGTLTGNGSTSASSILNDILACQKGPIKLTAGRVGPNAGRTVTPHVGLYLIRTYALQALAQLIDASLWETRFNADNTVDFQNQTGSLTSVKTFNEGENLLDLQEDYGADTMVNDVVVSGAGSAQPNPLNTTISDSGINEEVDNSPANGPRITKFYNLSNIFDKTILETYATALAKDLQFSQFSYPIDVVDLLPGVNWHLGDVVTLNSPTLGIQSLQYRALKEQRSFDSTQHEQIKLTLLPNIHEASVAHTRLRALEYVLNSQTQNGQLFANTVNQQPQGYPTQVSLGSSGLSNNSLGVNQYGAAQLAIGLSGLWTSATFKANFNLSIPSGGGLFVGFWITDITAGGTTKLTDISTQPSVAGTLLLNTTTNEYLSGTTQGSLTLGPYTATDLIDHIIGYYLVVENGSTGTLTFSSGSFAVSTSLPT
jgi:hypothetical protein